MQLSANTAWLMLLCLLTISTISCKKFLTAYSQNNSFVESAADLNEILLGDAYSNQLSSMYAMDDDEQLGTIDGTYKITMEYGFHFWQAEPRINTEGYLTNTDQLFNNLYNRIARINAIIHNVPGLKEKGESEKELNRISGEARFLRAYYYFVLVNMYGKPYKPSTAAIDFGVPLKITPDIKDQFSSRSTTKQVYDLIISDLLEAEKELADANLTATIRANQASVQALLSKVHLFMENYEQALYYANQVMKTGRYKLKDLNFHTEGEDFLNRTTPEVIFTMGSSGVRGSLLQDIPDRPYYRASDELISGYTPQDLRLQVFFIKNSRGEMKVAKKRKSVDANDEDVSDLFLLRLSEVYLNKAEALAGLERFEEARVTLQELKKNRFKPLELPPVSADGPELLNIIRQERRLELCFESHRWFDLRRYGVNSKYPFSKTITHRALVFTGSGYEDIGYYELKPYEQDAAAYIVPIANDEIAFNQGLLFNEPRPPRLLKQ